MHDELNMERPSEALSEPVSYETFIRVVAELSARISSLESLLSPKAYSGPAPATVDGTPVHWIGVIDGLTMARQRRGDHARFVPDYDSEGTY